MKTLTSIKIDWKKLVVVAAILLLAIVLSVGSTWFFLEDANLKEVESLQSRIDKLESENVGLNQGLEASCIQSEVGKEAIIEDEIEPEVIFDDSDLTPENPVNDN